MQTNNKKLANGQASGLVLTPGFLVVLNHSVAEEKQVEEGENGKEQYEKLE